MQRDSPLKSSETVTRLPAQQIVEKVLRRNAFGDLLQLRFYHADLRPRHRTLLPAFVHQFDQFDRRLVTGDCFEGSSVSL